MISALNAINGFIWGVPALLSILSIGLYLTLRTGFAQIRLFPTAICRFLAQFCKKERSKDALSPFQALCTALAATVGTGNLAGVAGAICIGGPGAVFWMWICAFLGMIIKFAEAAMAMRYKVRNSNQEQVGGPMYMIEKGMGCRWKWLAGIYSFFGVIAAFGVGNATQINTVICGINEAIIGFGGEKTQIGNFLVGIILAILIFVMLSGGAKRIGIIAEKLVPFAATLYLILGFTVLIVNSAAIPMAFRSIVVGAFHPRAVTGGVIGSVFATVRIGISRGVFTNEAGMGTASIAHAGAKVDHPVEQGLMGIIEVFLDTIVICTVTALVILCSGVKIPYGTDVGISLTTAAFVSVFGEWVSVLIAALLCSFAIATVVGWGLYGIRCAQYLFGDSCLKIFIYIQTFIVLVSALLGTGTVWILTDIVNGLMVIPNLISLGYLTPEFVNLIIDFKRKARPGGRALNQDSFKEKVSLLKSQTIYR